jgi:hypothetical protein
MCKTATKTMLCVWLFAGIPSAELYEGIFITPGIKIGFNLSPRPNVTFGLETSLNYFRASEPIYGGTPFVPFTGIVGGIQINSFRWRLSEYIEGQFGLAPVGVALGCSWSGNPTGSIRAFTALPSALTAAKYMITSFISYRYLFKTQESEIAVIGKYPFMLHMISNYGPVY